MNRFFKKTASALLTMFVAAACAFSMPQTAAAGGNLAVLSPSASSVLPGATFTVTAGFSSDVTLISAQLDMGYTAGVLELISTEKISATQIGSGNPFRAIYDNDNGTKATTLVRATFRVSASAAAGTTATVSATGAYGSDESFSKVSLAAASVTIKVAGSTAPTSSAGNSTPPPTPSAPAASTNAKLSSLQLEGINLNFSPTITEYAASVDNSVTSVKVTAAAQETAARVTVAGHTNLKVGMNYIIVRVTAPDGKTIKQYNIGVTRAAAGSAVSSSSQGAASVSPPQPGASSGLPAGTSSGEAASGAAPGVSSMPDSSVETSGFPGFENSSSDTPSGIEESTSSAQPEPAGTNAFLQWLRKDRSAWAVHAAYIGGMIVCLLLGCTLGYFLRGRKKEK